MVLDFQNKGFVCFFITSVVDCRRGSFPRRNQTFLFLSKPAGITINTRVTPVGGLS